MTVHVNEQQEQELVAIATATGRRTDDLVREAIDDLLAYHREFCERVQEGLRELNEGRGVPHETVRQRFAEYLD